MIPHLISLRLHGTYQSNVPGLAEFLAPTNSSFLGRSGEAGPVPSWPFPSATVLEISDVIPSFEEDIVQELKRGLHEREAGGCAKLSRLIISNWTATPQQLDTLRSCAGELVYRPVAALLEL